MNRKMDDDDHPHQGKRKKMRTSSSMNHHHHHHHHLFNLLPHLFDILSEQVINLFNLLPEEVIIDQILLKLPMESLFELLPDEQAVVINPFESLFDLLPDEQAVVINPFDLLPEEVIIDQILLKLPVESLLSLRCVSKCLRSLITSPSFVRLHTQQLAAQDHHSDLILFSTRAPKDIVYPLALADHIAEDEYKDYLIRNYICKFSAADGRDTSRPEVVEMNCPFPSTDIRASCNGLLYVHGRPICAIKSSPRRPCFSQGYVYTASNRVAIKSSPRRHCFSQGYVYTASNRVTRRISPSYIWNPCTKEYKEIPSPPTSTLLKDQQVVYFDDLWHQPAIATVHSNCNSAGFCGFGYDCANNEYKILYYEHLASKCSISSVPTTEFKVYTLGTNTWTSVSDNPYRSLFFRHEWLKIGLFVNGALHWIISSEISSRCVTKAKIISFDIEKEVFQEVEKPPLPMEEENKYLYGNLQMLKGCLCVCQFPEPNSMEEVDIWMLKDYAAKDSWIKFLRVEIRPRYPFNYLKEVLSIGGFKLLRYCENGEIAMLTNSNNLVLYYPYYSIVTPAKKFEEDVKGSWQYQLNFRKSLASLNSGTYTR